MKSNVFALTFTLLFSTFLYGQSNNGLVQQTKDCADRGDFVCAESTLLLLIQKETDKELVAGYYSSLGTYQRRQGKINDAFKSYNQAIEINPLGVDTYTN